MSHNLSKINSITSHDDFFDDFFQGRFPTLWNERRSLIQFPKVNISDNEHSVVVTANVPGIPSKDITIEVEDNILTISGHTKREEEEGKKDSDFYRFEREEGSFMRSVSLPSPVDKNNIDAKTKNGVLTITLAKTEKSETNKIHIREE